MRDHADFQSLFGVSPFRTHSWLPGGWSDKKPSPIVTRSSRNLGGTSGTVAQVWLPGGPVYARGVSGLAIQGLGQLPRSLQWACPRALGLGAGGDTVYGRCVEKVCGFGVLATASWATSASDPGSG